ncbi:non-homologous end-joining DNA ligase [Ancylobacter sp. MQZ15Z-1]|uniref:Non-homologous end-joining DNA ligase n=1 Tax=Ancylobacter mangrovi TaxID=2972472 RepID=A0A9X2PDW2_9HYPH|nr:non-homologous end-joining DNA ligase [Ancylobacter mangrovi]MCS0494328.1 non-homologous end-joining DNA ligase [Ancylobacter mangrovi]
MAEHRPQPPQTARPSLASASTVALSHPDRVYWPREGITKQDLADYYARVWPFIAPFLLARPLALVRCPDGIEGPRFFQKHAWAGMHRAVRVTKDRDGEEILSIDDVDGLMALVQAGALEIHPWGAPLADREHPDMLVFDLDPGEDVAWPAVVEGAREVRARLEQAGLSAFVKTSGGKGFHIVVPLAAGVGWEAAKRFAHAVAEAMEADSPGLYIAAAAKARRGGHIFVDYLRNARGATAIVAYGTRARPGAPVAMPVAWDELDALDGAAQFTLANAPARLDAISVAPARDPWAGFHKAAAALPEGA